MRKFLVPLVLVSALGLTACGDEPNHHPLHYAKLYQDKGQHVYTYIDNTWWLFNNTSNTWVTTTVPNSYAPLNYANAKAGTSSQNMGLVEVKDGKPGSEEFEGTTENLEGATVEDAGATAVDPAETGGGSDAQAPQQTPPDAAQTKPPEAEQETTETPEVTPAPEAEQTPEEAPEAPAEAPSEGGGESAPSDAGGGSDSGGGSSDGGGGGGSD